MRDRWTLDDIGLLIAIWGTPEGCLFIWDEVEQES
jgi:hypothetical protein